VLDLGRKPGARLQNVHTDVTQLAAIGHRAPGRRPGGVADLLRAELKL
jgi:hypothetical protein